MQWKLVSGCVARLGQYSESARQCWMHDTPAGMAEFTRFQHALGKTGWACGWNPSIWSQQWACTNPAAYSSWHTSHWTLHLNRPCSCLVPGAIDVHGIADCGPMHLREHWQAPSKCCGRGSTQYVYRCPGLRGDLANLHWNQSDLWTGWLHSGCRHSALWTGQGRTLQSTSETSTEPGHHGSACFLALDGWCSASSAHFECTNMVWTISVCPLDGEIRLPKAACIPGSCDTSAS